MLLLLTLLSALLALPGSANALSGSDFRAGNIIADTVFFNRDSLTTTQVQEFLNAKVPNCDVNGSTSPFYDRNGNRWNTRADYGRANGAPPPYTCLKSYTQAVPETINSGSDLCAGSISGGTKSAAQIIYDVSRACYINPQTLVVLLQKEQSLVTDEWPWPIQYRSATGYGCPDTAPCDSEYYGFFNQVYQAAKAYKRYAANPANYNYRANRDNSILYNPNTGCGSSNVYIQNQATAGLYIYTPYQPNQAALNNLYGTGDGCSAYGNRNFWRLFNDWFGNPHQPYPPLDTPRWMRVKQDTKKFNVYTGAEIGSIITQGTQRRFVDKILVNGTWFLRTEYDSVNNLGQGVALGTLEEIPYENFSEPRYMVLTQETRKQNPRSQVEDQSAKFSASTSINFSRKIYVNNQWLYQTAFDASNNYDRAIPASRVADISFQTLDVPRFMVVKNGAQPLNLRQNTTLPAYTSDTRTMIYDKTYVNGTWYLRTQSDSNSNNVYGIPATQVEEEVTSSDFAVPYIVVKIISDTQKYSVATSTPLYNLPVKSGQIVKIAGKLSTNGATVYFHTLYDKTNSFNTGIHLGDATIVNPTFVPLQVPRQITLNSTTKKINLASGELTDVELASGRELFYKSKFEINGIWYLRTEFDTNNNLPYGIPMDKLDI